MATVLAVSVEGSAMRGGIDPASHPTKYDEPAGRQVAGQALGHANAIGRRMPGSDHSNAEADQ